VTVNIQVRIEGRRGVLTLNGPLTLETKGILQERIDDLLRQGIRDFVLEIAGVPFMDSAGLGQLVQAYKTIKGHGAHLRIVGVTGRMQELVSLVQPPSDASAPAPDPVTARGASRPSRLAVWLALSVMLLALLLLIFRTAVR
jgi:anti-sigma B factor antagonist